MAKANSKKMRDAHDKLVNDIQDLNSRKEFIKAKIKTAEAQEKINEFVAKGYGNLPICIAKTQYSLSDDPKKLGNPEGFTLTVRDCYISAGAGYLVILTGTIVTMPGLPPHPAAMDINIDNNGVITGLF